VDFKIIARRAQERRGKDQRRLQTRRRAEKRRKPEKTGETGEDRLRLGKTEE
jgi:uncharacterized protein (DUF2249 family)